MLLRWAVAYNVPVDRLAWQTAVDVVQGRCQQTVFFVGYAITGFFEGLRAPVLVMFGASGIGCTAKVGVPRKRAHMHEA